MNGSVAIIDSGGANIASLQFALDRLGYSASLTTAPDVIQGADRVILHSRPVFDGPRETPEEIDAWEKKPRVPVRAVATG